jgi:hypothetical protein
MRYPQAGGAFLPYVCAFYAPAVTYLKFNLELEVHRPGPSLHSMQIPPCRVPSPRSIVKQLALLIPLVLNHLNSKQTGVL